ncbi:MAG: serine hydrolase domain-containing protein [Alphaproteobacteria bacterium]
MTTEFDRRALLAGLGLAGAASALPAWAQREAMPAAAAPPMPTVPGVPGARPPSVGVASDIDARIAQFMQRQMAANQLTGGVTAVARKNKLVHFQAHGALDIEAGTKMRTDNLMVMMSSTKPTTAVALLQQMEAGKISLDDKVSKFIPELKEMRVLKVTPPQYVSAGAISAGAAAPAPARTDPAARETVPANRELTIKDLATHTSGLNGTPQGVPPGTPNTLAARIPYLKNTPLDFQPGSRWAYSATTGPDVLARIVEITSGVPHDVYMRERVFEPIGMKDTAWNLTAEQAARVVPRYTRTGNAWVKARANPAAQTTYFAGSFGLSSTAMDYLLFETMLLNKGTINGKHVLKASSVELMHKNLIGDLYHGINGVTEGTGFGILVRTVLDPNTCGCGRKTGGFGWGGAYGTMTWTDPLNDLVGVYFVQQPHDELRQEYEYVVKSALS